ncbi:D-glycero-beta-D-manno-heptose 1,7-bisphosphate 7-phosphatase [Campylobacter sp.]|uniref:D-glycero-beta-D-manno-heptose 1,7-bisphosphate 7-phosphatase n=1 Tax=Campylobacter sp. TaxID=205 RepID=UPI00259C9AD7|nr:D-glycero-beta-D-manno-heptose 1,7-bisphosphate 7-phosphatase [Campylobacter sp.]MBQ7136030.1 D-glycero-beta-D-manno-heptose 1,7-bisphosphate 7-phosphatase [Campylobacter sp.]
MEKIKALFLDRDGVINYDPGYVYRIEDFEFMPGIFEALAGFMALGYEIFVVTNQSGIGRGYYSEDDFAKLSKYMIDEFKSYGVEIKKIYHCPHTPSDDCNCRKPRPGMILQALNEHNIDPQASLIIGDKPSDLESARRAGVERGYLIGDEFKSVLEVLEYIKGQK